MGRRSESPQPRRRGSRSASMSRSHSRSPSRSPKDKAGNKRASSRSRSPSHSRSKSRSPSRGRKNDGGRRRSRSRERNDRHRDDRRGGGRDRGGDRRRSRSRSGSRGRRDGGGHMNRGRPEPQSLLVRNLDPSTTEADLRHAFTRNEGDIRDVYIPKEFGGSQPRGFAFIEFNDRNVARERKYEMDRTELQGREIAVLFAQQRRKTPDQMREIMPMGGNSYRGRSDHREGRGGRDHENRRSPIRD